MDQSDHAPLLFECDGLQVRALAESDLATLGEWLANPEVAQYYGGRDLGLDEGSLCTQFWKPDRAARGERRCLVAWQGRSVGYLQFYPVDEAEQRAYGFPQPAERWGIDLFLGDPAVWNRGLGTRLVRATLEYIEAQYRPTSVLIDPLVTNHRAIRCYEKAGFHPIRRLPHHEWHEGAWRDCCLMEWSPTPPSPSR
jgi:aminoglycoside 6'-N-acetyltransferase